VAGDLGAVRRRLADFDDGLVVTHERPDGDAIGSLLGLTLSLRKQGKRAVAVIPGGLPERFASLPGGEWVRSGWPADPTPVIAVDCADQERIAPPWPPAWPPPDVNIDHHATNTRFGQVNLIDPRATATAEVLYDLASELGLPLDADVATNLLAGIVTDTIGFRTDNVTPAALRKAAALVEAGGRLQEVYERLLTQRPLASARYWGAGLSHLQRQGDVLWSHLTLDDRVAAGYEGDDDADLVNFLSTVDGASVTVLFVEQPGSKVKVSWRARGGVDVSRLAQTFGGGGHEPAAGATLDGRLEDVERLVLTATARSLSGVAPTQG